MQAEKIKQIMQLCGRSLENKENAVRENGFGSRLGRRNIRPLDTQKKRKNIGRRYDSLDKECKKFPANFRPGCKFKLKWFEASARGRELP